MEAAAKEWAARHNLDQVYLALLEKAFEAGAKWQKSQRCKACNALLGCISHCSQEECFEGDGRPAVSDSDIQLTDEEREALFKVSKLVAQKMLMDRTGCSLVQAHKACRTERWYK